MRCPDCNKFVGLDMQEPEVENIEVAADEHGLEISATVRIIRACAECGTELKEATLDLSDTVEWSDTTLGEAPKNTSEVEVQDTSAEPLEEGGGRYKKSYYGAQIAYDVTLGDKVIYSGDMSDKTPASCMDELV